MLALLRVLPAIVVVLAAIESVSSRLRLPWRDIGAELFLQAALLWFVFGLLALVPAALTLRIVPKLRRLADDDARAPFARTACLSAWMVLPVAAHHALDEHVGMASDLSGLREVRAWLDVLIAVLAVATAVALVFYAQRFWRRSLTALLLVAACGVGAFLPLGPDAPGASSVRGSEPSVDTAERPNLLFIVWDTCRPDRLTPYGYDRGTTPHLAEFADSAIVFESAVSTATFTFTSHLTMLTGVYPSTHGARLLSTRFDPRRAQGIATPLRAAGYRTGAFVGTDVLSGRTGLRAGFDVYDDRVDPSVCDTFAWKLVHDLQAVGARFVPALRGNGRPHWFQTFQRPASQVLDAAQAWIEADDPRPWFCFVNLYDVHWPYVPTADGLALVEEYTGPLDGYLFRSDRWSPGYEMQPNDVRHVSELYDGELVELDQVVDRFFDTLDLERGGTAVLLTSDHGEAFGEAGHWSHEDPSEPEVRIPMILRLPEPAPTGRRVGARVSGVDVAPTLLELAGLPLPVDDDSVVIEGRSLLGPTDPERLVFVEDRDHLDPRDVRIALYRGPWKLRRWGLGDEARYALYDLRVGEFEGGDVSAAHPDVFAELKLALAERRDALDREEGVWDSTSVLAGAADGLEALGYTGE